MKKLLINIALLIAVVLITFWGTRRYYPRTLDRTVTDTVRVDVPYEVKVFQEVEKPVTVTEYKTVTDTIRSVDVVKDTVFIETDNTEITYGPAFLTQYPNSPRFLGLEKQNENLSLTYQDTEGKTQAKYWHLRGRTYSIGLNNSGQPVLRSRPDLFRFSQSIQAGYLIANYNSPYLEYNVNLTAYGVTATGSANINRQPFGTIGVKYSF